MIEALAADADRALSASDLGRAPAPDICWQVLAYGAGPFRRRTAWDMAAAQATRLVAVLPAGRSDDTEEARHATLGEIAKAFASYPPDVVQAAADELMASQRYRPVPAVVHEVCRAIQSRIARAIWQADRVMKARAALQDEQRAKEQEALETRRAIAEGRETPAQRRGRMADQARAMIRGIWRDDDGKELRAPGA